MSKQKTTGFALLLLAILSCCAMLQAVPVARAESMQHDAASAIPPLKETDGKVWVCPMHPEIMQDHPGACPICGMDLVESHGTHEAHKHGVTVSSATVQKLGVRLVHAKQSTISRNLTAYGAIVADGAGQYAVHSYFDGWIKKLHIRSVGQKVEQGQVLYEIYSPDLVMQQKEYLNFVARRKQILQSITGDALIFENMYVMDLLEELSRERIKLIEENLSPDTLQYIEDHRQPLRVVPILAPKSGVVTKMDVREGGYVTPSATLLTLENTARVWVDIALYPSQAAQVLQQTLANLNSVFAF